MGVLSGLRPERVFYYFEELSKIPHGSYHTKAVSDYCASTARAMGLEVRQDEAFNVVIKKPASAGSVSGKTLMIQGHLDMVCVKDEGVVHDFDRDGLKLVVENGYVRASGTTLGGDDGIAVAMGLALLEDEQLMHPALEVVFTTEEEVGMDGAEALDTSDLHADYLMNLDSEEEGHFLAGCAGGVKALSTFDIETETAKGTAIDLKINGLAGGHSGMEIGKCRANAIILLGRLLCEIDKAADFRIASVGGGAKDNAIPVDAEAKIVVSPEDVKAIIETAVAFEKTVKTEFRTSDPGIRVTAGTGENADHAVFTRSLQSRFILMLLMVPNGIQTMSADLPDMPESSLNLGILGMENGKIRMTWAIRSALPSLKLLMQDKLENLTALLGGEISFSGDYPSWAFDPDGEICELCRSVYEEQTQDAGCIETIHAGLECGLIKEKMPGLDIVSMGPNILDIHTTREKMEIASVARVWQLVTEVIRRLA